MKLARGKCLTIPDDAKASTAAMFVWIDTNRGEKRRKLDRKTSNGPAEPAARRAPRSRKQKTEGNAASMVSLPGNSIRTPLRIPYGNKEVALKLGARYG